MTIILKEFFFKILNLIKKIFIPIIFLIDLLKARYDRNYSGSEKSFFLMRFLYRISNGLILEFIGKIIKSSSDPLFFKKTYEILNNIDEKDIQILKDEILNLKVSTNEKYNQNKDIIYNIKSSKAEIDYDYYKKFNAVRLNFNQKDLLSSKVISEFIIKSNFSKIIDKIIGAKTCLISVDSWITLPIPEIKENYEEMTKYQDTQMFHRDVDHLRDIKLFIYLNDVLDYSDGPFQIIQGTNGTDNFNQKNYIDKVKFRISNHFAKKNYENNIKTFYGKKGTAFIADTRAFHRGSVITKLSHRTILALYYSTHSFGKNKKITLDKNFKTYDMWKQQIKQNKYMSLFY